MKFTPTPVNGAYVVELEPIVDPRGFFARAWCRHEFERHGLNPNLAQCSVSFNHRKGTLRGLHYQATPYEEAKLVRCTAGAIYDVIVDLRRDSPSFKQWFAAELSVTNRTMMYVPEGVAHGFQTLEDGTELFYQVSEFYHPEATQGVRWDDPAFRIPWPLENAIIAERDSRFPDFIG